MLVQNKGEDVFAMASKRPKKDGGTTVEQRLDEYFWNTKPRSDGSCTFDYLYLMRNQSNRSLSFTTVASSRANLTLSGPIWLTKLT